MTAVPAASPNIDARLALVIDDDVQVRQFVAATLGELGMKVTLFQMAKEALSSLDRAHPAVIFLDVALLRSDAIDVLRGLGERRYGGIVQLMSGGRRALLEAVQRIGVRHGIRLATPLDKPFSREAIVRLIETLASPDAVAMSKPAGDAAAKHAADH